MKRADFGTIAVGSAITLIIVLIATALRSCTNRSTRPTDRTAVQSTNTTRIIVRGLYNIGSIGNDELIRYTLTADVPEEKSAEGMLVLRKLASGLVLERVPSAVFPGLEQEPLPEDSIAGLTSLPQP